MSGDSLSLFLIPSSSSKMAQGDYPHAPKKSISLSICYVCVAAVVYKIATHLITHTHTLSLSLSIDSVCVCACVLGGHDPLVHSLCQYVYVTRYRISTDKVIDASLQVETRAYWIWRRKLCYSEQRKKG